MANKEKTNAVTIKDVRMNEAVAHSIVDDHPKQISGMVGITALGKLAELMCHDDYVKFVGDALQHAQTGQLPADAGESDNQEQDQQPQAGAAPAPQTPQNGGTGNGTPSANY